MIPNDYDLWLEHNQPAITATATVPAPSAADMKRAEAVRFIESAQDQAARARRAVIAAGEDPTGLDRILRDLDRELTWLRG